MQLGVIEKQGAAPNPLYSVHTHLRAAGVRGVLHGAGAREGGMEECHGGERDPGLGHIALKQGRVLARRLVQQEEVFVIQRLHTDGADAFGQDE
jgi:hypothetical protein